MSKKKNTLRDLDEFLKQQAATLVSPVQLGDQIEKEKPAPESIPAPTPTPVVAVAAAAPPAAAPPQEATVETIGQALKTIYSKEGGPAFRRKLYDIILQGVEAQGQSLPEDKMLINTVLYLKSGDQWKETIREYWKNK